MPYSRGNVGIGDYFCWGRLNGWGDGRDGNDSLDRLDNVERE